MFLYLFVKFFKGLYFVLVNLNQSTNSLQAPKLRKCISNCVNACQEIFLDFRLETSALTFVPYRLENTHTDHASINNEKQFSFTSQQKVVIAVF